MNERDEQEPIGGPDVSQRSSAGHAGSGSRAGVDPADQQAGLESAHANEQNTLLRALPLDEYARVVQLCTSERMRMKQNVVEPNVPMTDVYFPRVGVCSMLAELQEGGTIEVGTIGPEGFIGIPVLLGGETMPYRVIVQIEGDAWRMHVDTFRRLVGERSIFRGLLLRFTQYFTNQLSQSVACNRLHTLEERCARWLLMTHDRVHGDHFELTQEFLSMMLGVHRPSVSLAMGMIQSAGLVKYSRGRVRVLDREKLEQASCDCYRITQAEQERLLRVSEV